MPMIKRQRFIPLKPPPDLKPDEDIFFFKLTNEVFRNYEEYFERVILCNSLVWSCTLTGKINLTFQEALDSEQNAKKLLHGLEPGIKIPMLFLTNLTHRAKVSDVCEDIFSYAREHYFKGESVLSVIGNFWCHSRVVRVISPTMAEVDAYKKDQIEKGEYENNDYLTDESWGPPPDLYRYEVQEIDSESDTGEVYILDAIDVKREKQVLTRDKCKFLMKLSTYYSENDRVWRVEDEIAESCGLQKITFGDIFDGNPPIFEKSLGPEKVNKRSKEIPKAITNSHQHQAKNPNETFKTGQKPANTKQKGSKQPNGKIAEKSLPRNPKSTSPNSKKNPPKEKELTSEEIKQIEIEKRAKNREKLKAEKKLIADFKKLWFKPREDLEVEDLKDIPQPDPIAFKIPNHLFGDFVMILEYFNCYSSILKVRDCFPTGLTFDILERALLKSEIAGPFSDILQLLLRTIFRCQMSEDAEIVQDEATAASVELGIDEITDCTSAVDAIQQATTAATWSIMYQNTPLHKLTLDHLSLTEVLRLHVLSSGARPTDKNTKWRLQQRGGYASIDDAGLQLRMEEPQILKILTNGTVFDLNISERIKLIHCLINQILTFVSVRDIIEESFELFKQARINSRSLQAAEKRKETEDNVWRQKLKIDKRLPPVDFMKTVINTNTNNEKKGGSELLVAEMPDKSKLKPELTDEQVESHLAKKDKEIARRKQDYEWKMTELSEMINKHERKLGLHPIGKDRTFRRYWIFTTMPGLFVEDDDDTIGTCLTAPRPYYSDVNLEDVTFVRENFEKFLKYDKDGSDKENSTSVTPKKVSKKKSLSVTDIKVLKVPDIYGICSGDPNTCTVHCPRTIKWYFYWSPEHLDGLINGLTPRGIREVELRNNLKEERSGIGSLLQRCPVQKLNTEKNYPEHVTAVPERRPQRAGQNVSKGGLDPNLNYPTGTKIEKIVELQLRDLILETEEKIFLGALGSLKINDRAEWRQAIEQGSYNAQTNTLKWGDGRSQSLPAKTLESEIRSQEDEESSPLRRSAEDSVEVTVNPIIKSLACAVLQLEQGVEAKFFKRPLGNEKEEEKKKKSAGKTNEVDQAVSKGKWIQGSPLERWEASLLKCTSFSQIFVHLFTLDNSIEWTRSVLNARCRVCRRKGDSENMLLCDGCNKGHHAYCVKPPLDSIPKTDWFCADCKPPEPPPKKRQARKQYLSDEDIEEELNGSNEESDSSDAEGDSDTERSSPGPANLELAGSEVEVCADCGYGGEVICCDSCPLVFHLQCLDPPKSRVPRGAWFCPECENPRKKRRTGSRNIARKKKIIPRKRSGRRRLSSSEDEDDETEENEDETESQDTNEADDTDQEEQSASESDESNSTNRVAATPLVKMKFNTKKSAVNYGTRSSDTNSNQRGRVTEEDSDESDEVLGRGKKRKCATLATAKISKAVKRLRSDSKENETSDNSNDSSNSNSSRRVQKHGHDNNDSDDTDVPKRTRLQRMNTNRCGDSGDLDNVLLDRLISDIMKQSSAWPFVKPVTRNDAPDYHEIVKFPMDLGTIKYKLNSMVYTCNQEFFADLQLVFDNCFMYNQPTNNIHQAGVTLRTYCERRCGNLGVHFSDSN